MLLTVSRKNTTQGTYGFTCYLCCVTGYNAVNYNAATTMTVAH